MRCDMPYLRPDDEAIRLNRLRNKQASNQQLFKDQQRNADYIYFLAIGAVILILLCGCRNLQLLIGNK